MASLFKGLSKAFWGAFAKPDSRKETFKPASQQQSENLHQISRKRPLEDEADDTHEPNKKALLFRLGGPSSLNSDSDYQFLDDQRYIGAGLDFIEEHDDGRFEDPEDQLAEDIAEAQFHEDEQFIEEEAHEPYIKQEEEIEFLHRDDEPGTDDNAPSSLFDTLERQARNSILHDQLESAVTKRIWLEKHLAARAKETELLRHQGFSEDTVSIHQRIGLRGIIPTFPSTWAYDLDTLHPKHFTDKPSEAFISSLSDNDFRAVKAFRRLMDMGAWARDAVANEAHTSPNRKPEKLVQKEIEAYVKWAFKDGLLDTNVIPPTIGVYSAPPGADLKKFQLRVTLDLLAMKDSWRAKLHDESLFQNSDFEGFIPDVYAIAIVNTKVRFVVLHEWYDEPTVVIWSELDFASPDYDFWNAQAVALMVVHCRNNMVDLEDILRADPDVPS